MTTRDQTTGRQMPLLLKLPVLDSQERRNFDAPIEVLLTRADMEAFETGRIGLRELYARHRSRIFQR